MFYAILGIVVVVALFLIFRDDHDKSYNRNEKKAQRQSEGAKRQSSYTKKETSQPKAEFTFEHKAKNGAANTAQYAAPEPCCLRLLQSNPFRHPTCADGSGMTDGL